MELTYDKQICIKANLENAILDGTDLRDTVMENVNLNHASLKHAYIYKTILANTEFTNVDASYANFCGQDLTRKFFIIQI